MTVEVWPSEARLSIKVIVEVWQSEARVSLKEVWLREAELSLK